VAFVKSGTTCSLFLNGVLEATATTSEVMNTSSAASEFSIKRTFTQDTAVASLNTSLFKSRSWIEIAQLRVTKSARYTGNYIPDVFYGQ
jgi:peptidoglycan hydrolase-like protein with peptidoglycan-binding domain